MSKQSSNSNDADNALTLALQASEALDLPVLWPPLPRNRLDGSSLSAKDSTQFALPQSHIISSTEEVVAEACRRDERRAVEEAARAAASIAFQKLKQQHNAVQIEELPVEVTQLRGGVINQTVRASIFLSQYIQ